MTKFQEVINELYDLQERNEYRTFSYKGVRNISYADADEIIMYLETIEENGTYDGVLRQPVGNTKKVLSKVI